MADALDHRGVVDGVGEDHAAGQHGAQGLQGGLVGDVARGEDQRRLLAVQLGQLALERDVVGVGAGDVARAAGARPWAPIAACMASITTGCWPMAEVVVAAPDRDVAHLTVPMEARPREGTGDPLEVGEYAIAPFGPQAVEVVSEKRLIIHEAPFPRARV